MPANNLRQQQKLDRRRRLASVLMYARLLGAPEAWVARRDQYIRHSVSHEDFMQRCDMVERWAQNNKKLGRWL